MAENDLVAADAAAPPSPGAAPSEGLDNRTLGAAPDFFKSSRYLRHLSATRFMCMISERTVHCEPPAPCLWH